MQDFRLKDLVTPRLQLILSFLFGNVVIGYKLIICLGSLVSDIRCMCLYQGFPNGRERILSEPCLYKRHTTQPSQRLRYVVLQANYYVTHGTAKKIFDVIHFHIKEKGIHWKNCVGICTDGARAMCGKNSSVVTRLFRQSPCPLWTHCSIHRESLISKALPDDFKTVLNTAVKVVNFIKTRPLQARLFQKLCKEMGSPQLSLLMHTEFRWLSRENVLSRLVELNNEVTIYLEKNLNSL